MMEFATATRPWPEESRLPRTEANRVSTVVLMKTNAIAEAEEKKSSTNKDLNGVMQRKVVTNNNKNLSNLVLAPSTSLAMTFREEARQRRSERKSHLQLVQNCVTKVVDETLRRTMKKPDPKRSQAVLENTRRTVEALFEERFAGGEKFNMEEIKRHAEKVCALNMGLLFDHRECLENIDEDDYDSTISSSAAFAASLKRPRRVPLVEISSDSFSTPLQVANQKLQRALSLPSSVNSDSSQKSVNPFVTPVQKRND